MASRLTNLGLSPAVLERVNKFYLYDCNFSRDGDVIGNGAHSDVFKGQLSYSDNQSKTVAAKRMRVFVKDDQKKLFDKEIYVWSKLEHDNILPLLGFTFDAETGYPQLFSPWMTKGSASKYVKANQDFNPFHLIFDIASGLNYLHGRNVYHSDIKGDNIFVSVSENGQVGAIIGDFGAARIVGASLTVGAPSSTLKGTYRWMARELASAIMNNQLPKYTKATDVWAFGMTVYELFTRKPPFHEVNDDHALMQINGGMPPSFPTELRGREMGMFLFEEICMECWKHWEHPEKRISMPAILEKLGSSPHNEKTRGVDNGPEDNNGDIRVEHVKTYRPGSPVSCVRFSGPGNGNKFAVGCKGVIFVYDLDNVESVMTYRYPPETSEPIVQNLCFINFQGKLASCSGDDKIRTFNNSNSRTNTRVYGAKGQNIRSLICAQGLFICGLENGNVCTIDKSEKSCTTFEHHGKHPPVTTVAISQNNRFVAAKSSSGVRIWDATSMKLVHEAIEHSEDVASIVFPSKNELIIAGGTVVKRWDISGSPFEPHFSASEYSKDDQHISTITVSPEDQHWVIGAAKNGTVHFWARDAGLHEGEWKHPDGQVTLMEFCPTSNKFVTVTDDGRVDLWSYPAK